VRRRRLIALLAGTAVAWPLAARAQKATKIPHVVVISPGPLPDRYRELFRDLGYIAGHNIRLEFRDAGGYADRLSMLTE
jgi:putative tryptophan/tyrosine transport system substrate-binding protein